MPRLENAGGDRLAQGAVRHTFKPMGEKLTREKWDEMFSEEPQPEVKVVYLFCCPVHGIFQSQRECYLSGGYPLLNENAKGKCPKVENGFTCQEDSKYAGIQPINGGADEAVFI
jgi:hypothetical protein